MKYPNNIEKETLKKTTTKLKILICYDEHGWAWWHRAHNIKSCLSDHFTIDIVKINNSITHANYDYILLFESYLYNTIKHIPPEKIIIGSSTLKTINISASDYQNHNFSGLFVNNLESYQIIHHLKNTFYCPNGVNEKLFSYKFPRCSEITACWVGNNASMNNKGLDIIKQACLKTSINLIVLDQSKNVYNGNIFTHRQVRDKIYHKSSFYICASEMEGTPNPALESLACGLPVISTRVGNMPEIIVDGYNGYLIERSIDSLCEAIEKMKQSDLLSMSINARESILKGWTWEQQSTRYSDAFHTIHQNSHTIYTDHQTPLVSIIIPTFNRPQELIEAIESVRNQSFQNFEIIVVNDCGYDIKKLLSTIHDHRIIYKSHDINKGLAAARNTGIRLARGKYIAYLDDDDEFYPDHIQTLVDELENSNFKAAYTDGEKRLYEERNDELFLSSKFVEHSSDFDPLRILAQNYIPVLCMMHEKSCLDHIGLFDETMSVHEDWDLWARLSRLFPFKHIKKTTCSYKIIVNAKKNLTTSKQLDFVRTMQQIYRKHHNTTKTIPQLTDFQHKCLISLTQSRYSNRSTTVISVGDDFNIYINDTLLV